MDILVKFGFSLLETFVSMLFLSAFLEYKKYNRVHICITIFILSVVGTAVTEIFQHNISNLASSVSSIIFLAFYFYQGRRILKLLFSVLYVIFSILSEFAAIIFIYNVNLINTDGMIMPEGSQIFMMILPPVIKLIVILWLRIKIGKKKILGSNKIYFLQSIIPVLSVIFLVFYVNVQLENENFFLSYIVIILFVIINIVQYYVYNRMETLYAITHDKELREQRMQYLTEYFATIESNMEKLKIVKHDMSNQLLTLRGYIEKDKEQAIKEIDRMVKDTDFLGVHTFTKNSGINALLNVKYNKSIDLGIQVDFDIKIPDTFTYIEVDEISAILGNLLDNAIESCEQVAGDKVIELLVFYYKNSLIIKMKNTTKDKIINLNTRKKDKEWHGLGMKSINYIVQKYNGDCEWKQIDNMFYTYIIMWNSKA